jgi:chromosome segregation ATPase
MSDQYVRELITQFDEQQLRLRSRKKKIQTEYHDWKTQFKSQLDDERNDLHTDQKRLTKLEAENNRLESDLGNKNSEIEKQAKVLGKEREKLSKRELELEKKIIEYETKKENYNNLLKEIEVESKKIKEERERLLASQQEFAKEVSNFETMMQEDKRKLKEEITSVSDEELCSEWLKLHTEEKRLNKIRTELLEVKEEFMNNLSSEQAELDIEREKLADEWEKIKNIRKNLKTSLPDIESKFQEVFDFKNKRKRNPFTKGRQAKFESMIKQLEERFFNELTDLLATHQIMGTSQEIDQEWAKIEGEKEKLDRIRTEMLDVKEQIIEKYNKQRDELNSERKKLEEKWKKLCKIQKQILDKQSQITSSRKTSKGVINKELDNLKTEDIKEFSKNLKKSTKLDGSLRELQKELRAEWTDLHKQHEKLTQIITEFSKAKQLFKQGQDQTEAPIVGKDQKKIK